MNKNEMNRKSKDYFICIFGRRVETRLSICFGLYACVCVAYRLGERVLANVCVGWMTTCSNNNDTEWQSKQLWIGELGFSCASATRKHRRQIHELTLVISMRFPIETSNNFVRVTCIARNSTRVLGHTHTNTPTPMHTEYVYALL